MKTAVEPVFVETHNVGETKRATIKASAKIFKFFADQIYSDKYTAIWRELVANGIDAQLMNGETRPVEVTLPSILEPQATIRDFGCSMDHEFMMTKFMAFTDASTKEHSNDYIGGFGIGSKAPLAYTDQYSIRCFLDGEVRVYSIYKDEEDCPCIAFLSKEDSDEPTGVEVSFPVRQNDIHSFNNVVVKTLTYFKPQPMLKNTNLKLPEVEYVEEGSNWGIRNKDSLIIGSNLVIGGIAYKIPEGYHIDYSYEKLRGMSSMPIDFHMDIGSVNISLSRESVTFDEPLYHKLETICGEIYSEIAKSTSSAFEDCKTLWEAREKKVALEEGSPNFIKRLIQAAEYMGEKFTTTIGRPEFGSFQAICYGTWNYREQGYTQPMNFKKSTAQRPKFVDWDAYGAFDTNSFDMIVLDDKPDIPLRRVMGTIRDNPGKKILFLRDNALVGPDWPRFIKECLGEPPKGIVHYLSKQNPIEKQKKAKGSTAPRPFKCYVTNNTYGPGRFAVPETSLPSGGGVYIPMDNFDPQVSRDEIRLLDQLVKPNKTIWLNKTDLQSSKVAKNADWMHISEAVKQFKADYRRTHKRIAEAGALSTLMHNEILKYIGQLSQHSGFPKRGPLAKLRKIYDFHKDTLTHSDDYIRSCLGIKQTKQEEKIKAIIEEVEVRHPVLWELIETDNIYNVVDSEKIMNRLF